MMAFKYRLGQEVEAFNNGQWLPARIVVLRNRSKSAPYTVRHDFDGGWFDWDVTARDIREPQEAKG